MKVALVSEWVDGWRGGAEKSTTQFLHGLTEKGVELHLYTRSRPSPTPGMAVHTVSGARMTRRRQSVTFAHRVEWMLRDESFDIIHAISPCRAAHIYQPRGGTFAETIERNLALRHSSFARWLKRGANRFNLKQRYLLSFERRVFRGSTGPIIVAISDYVVRQLTRHYGLPEARVRKIYNGVATELPPAAERAKNRESVRRDFRIGPDDLFVLLVAHNFKLKGVRRWMEALAVLVGSGNTRIRSVVVGKGDTGGWLRLASRLGIAQHLTLAGPSDRVPAFLDAADVLVHPTHYDPCSRVVLEGMVAGLPCITTCWDGASEVIEHGVNGFVLQDAPDNRALVETIRSLEDKDRRKSVGDRAAKIADRISMDRHVREMLELYEELRGR